MTAFRFLQFSDVHIDSELTHSALAWPTEKRIERVREINGLVERAMELARDRAVESVLIPGDLWDDEAVSLDSVHRLVEIFASIDPIPVFIAPGNHDFCSASSMYSPEVLRARGMRPWPSNVFIFDSPEFRSVFHPARSDVAIVGRAFLENVTTTERLLGRRIERPEANIRLLLFHGSLEGYTREDKRKITAPFSREELLEQEFSYTALGHYHHFDQVVDARGRIRAAYAGSLAARTLGEKGPKYALIGSVDGQGLMEDFDKIELDPRRIHSLEVDVTGADDATILYKIDRALVEKGCRPEDIVAVTVKGRLPKGASAEFIQSGIAGRFFHLKLFDETRPDYDLDFYDARTVEGRFIEEMRRGMDIAADDSTRRQLERALYYGLDALVQREVKPSYED